MTMRTTSSPQCVWYCGVKVSVHRSISSRALCWLFATSLVVLAGCHDNDQEQNPNKPSELKNYISFDLYISYLDDFDPSTQTFNLDDGAPALISLAEHEAYKLKAGEASKHQATVDFVYQISGSGRTGSFTNTGYFKPTPDGYQESPFGPTWTTWNETSVIAAAHTLITDPNTGSAYNLSDEEFDAIHGISGLSDINFGDNVSLPLEGSNQFSSTVHFDIWEDGKVEDNNYFAFKLETGSRGVMKVQKDDKATGLYIAVKMAY